jgi:hypothetical protein
MWTRKTSWDADGIRKTFLYYIASSGKRVGDFGPLLNCWLLLLLSLWACGQRACVVHHVHSDELVSSRVFVIGDWPPI